jgi:predicted dehydrogenase
MESDMSQLRYGILGTGNIANQFAEGVAGASRSMIAAVGSRTQQSAEAFASKHGVPTAHGSYEALIADDSVDAVYLSLPNSMHCEWTIRCLEAGKHVLCEKPIAADAAEAERMFAAADANGRHLVEAFMYVSHPQTQAVLRELRSGAIGELRLVRCSFNYCTHNTTDNIRFDAALAGGALMDIGCYCLSLARLAVGEEPEAAHAVGHLHESGVDDMAAGDLRFPGGVLAGFTCGMRAHADNTAYLCGTEGFIAIPVPWKPPRPESEYVVATMPAPRQDGGKPAGPTRRVEKVTCEQPLYGLEADAFAVTVLNDEPPAVSRQMTLGNMKLLDDLRQQIGVQWKAEPQ